MEMKVNCSFRFASSGAVDNHSRVMELIRAVHQKLHSGHDVAERIFSPW
jgi:hypothetical protein